MNDITVASYQFDRLLTIPQLSQRMGIPEATIRDWLHTRFIPFVKLGRRIYFDPDVINGWIAQRAEAGRLRRKTA